MKRIFTVAVTLVLLLAGFALLETRKSQAQGVRFTHVYDTVLYSQWGAAIAAGNAATGSQTITVCPAFVFTPDGRMFTPFSTSIPITIDQQNGTVKETVTPTAVSLITAPAAYPSAQGQCASVTATFANTHGSSLSTLQVVSGDSGVGEASADAANNGGGLLLPILSTGAITPAATAAAIGTTGQTFTLTGVTGSNNVIPVSAPAPVSLCPMVEARATAANQVTLYFTTLTAAACTPAAGTYTFVATR